MPRRRRRRSPWPRPPRSAAATAASSCCRSISARTAARAVGASGRAVQRICAADPLPPAHGQRGAARRQVLPAADGALPPLCLRGGRERARAPSSATSATPRGCSLCVARALFWWRRRRCRELEGRCRPMRTKAAAVRRALGQIRNAVAAYHGGPRGGRKVQPRLSTHQFRLSRLASKRARNRYLYSRG